MKTPSLFLPALLRMGGVVAAVCVTVSASAQLARKGALLLEEDFRQYETYTKERLDAAPGWKVRVAHGLWKRTAEGVESTETPGHQPVLVFEGVFGVGSIFYPSFPHEF